MSNAYTPLFSTRRFKRTYLLVVPFLVALVFFHFGYDGFTKVYKYHTQYESLVFRTHTNPYAISKYFPYLTIYPKNYNHKLPVASDGQKIIKFKGSPESVLTPEILTLNMTNHTISIYSSLQPSTKDCNMINYRRDLEISGYFVLNDDLIKMAHVLQDQLDNDEAFTPLYGFFEDRIPKILMKGHTRQHFYKFAGTSVWLEHHGVHLMVSRVIFTQTARKNDPQLSLLYAQVYDENWRELVDVELVMPRTDPDGMRGYGVVKFPKFMPVPFYHNPDNTRSRWYGPEDTRLLLARNKYGEDEPVIVFNAYHRQIERITDKNSDDKVKTRFEFYRSMFVGWLWQYQLGKLNTDGFQNADTANISYIRVKELRISGQERVPVEKNWTPFIDPSERNPTIDNTGDNHIYLIYQWNHLKVLRCELTDFVDDTLSTCTIFHKDHETDSDDVGPIRGGTELIAVPNTQGRLLWIGFLRAHIKKCGCGGSVYRPNFLVLERIQDAFKLTYLSGSITFDIPVYGWTDYETVCAGHEANALIPNGIGMFDPERDYLTLALSVADQDNTLIHVRGVKRIVELLEHSWTKGGEGRYAGNRQIECVVDHAIDTCHKYVEEHFRLGDSEAAKKQAEQERKDKEKAEKEKEEKEKQEKEKQEKEKQEKEKQEKEKQEKEKQEKEKQEKEAKEKAEEEAKEKEEEEAKEKEEDTKPNT
ncbi:Beta-mannosyltransferase 4 [Candida viswanathii]|uniref:Beta-mannosyltransferase 4 n=1 Tax=Candida viswanathii TaxID=5486 RepID=A0A367YHN5_9ASCO|nr:Beta-mannosyltransferase 4 [Candida viswanathii]